MENVRCLNCEGTEWENVDNMRIKPSGMHICKSCGFVTYPDKQKDKEGLDEFYREEYRQPPTVGNIYAGERKIHYHAKFLVPVFEEFKKQGRNNIDFLEIGAAFGMFLRFVKQVMPEANLYGTELTKSFRRVAFHEYGLNLTEDFDDTKQYDVIASYKVAEHIPNVDRELKRYGKCLKKDGLLYISVPTWFDRMCNFGLPGFDLEYYYHPNHINCWTRPMFESLLKRSGFEIIRQDYVMYDSTYLCKFVGESKDEPVYKENPDEIKNRMARIKQAIEYYNNGNHEAAIKTYPDFPTGHVARFEFGRKAFSEKGFDWIEDNIVKEFYESCPDCVDAVTFHGDLCLRFDKFAEAFKLFEMANEMRPNQPPVLIGMGTALRNLAVRSSGEDKLNNLKESIKLFRYLETVSLQSRPDAITNRFQDMAQIPTPME